MNTNILINKIHARLEDYNRYYYSPYFDVSFRFEQQFFAAKLLSVLRISDFRILFKVALPLMEELLNEPKYETFHIPKKREGVRLIQAPEPVLMKMQSRLNFYLQNYYHMIAPKGVHGFVINPNKKEKLCNIVENAKIHVQQKQVLNLDLKDFFPSIKAYRVKELFLSEHCRYNEKIATALALLVTYEGKLPTGAPTSPVISNFICLQLDADLIDFCNENQINFSRYADDLTFSSNKEITKEMISNIYEIIKQNNFDVNTKKTRLKSDNRKQTVTGLVVNEKVNVDRKMLKMVRAMLHDAMQNGISKAAKKHFANRTEISDKNDAYFLSRLEGYINFIVQVRGIEDALALKFKSDFKNLKA